MHFEFIPTHGLALTVPRWTDDWRASARGFAMGAVGLSPDSQKLAVVMGMRCAWTTWWDRGHRARDHRGLGDRMSGFRRRRVARLTTRY
jgi:hypothetical protein